MHKTIHEGIQDLIDTIESIKLDAQKFDEGNFSAGTRVTKALMAVSKECKRMRLAVFDIKSSRAK